MSGVTTKIREKLNFYDEELWKRFSSRRLKLIESNKLYYKKASDQDEEVKKIALILSSEFSLSEDFIDDVDKLVRAAIQSIRRNRKRSCKNSKNDENSNFIVVNEFEKKRKRSASSLNNYAESNSSTAVSSKCSSPSACTTPSSSSYSLSKPAVSSRKDEHFLNDILNIDNNNNNSSNGTTNGAAAGTTNTPSPRHSSFANASSSANAAFKSDFEFTYSKKQKFTNNDLSKMAINNFVQPKTKLFSSITGGMTANARQPYMGCSFFSSASSLKTNKYLLQYSTSGAANSGSLHHDSSSSTATANSSMNTGILSTPVRNSSSTLLLSPPPCCTPTSITSKRQLLNYFEKSKTCYHSSNFNKQSPVFLLGKTSLPNFINYLLVQMYPAKSNSGNNDNSTSVEYLRLKLNSVDVLSNFLKRLDPGNPDIKAMKSEISIDTLYYLIGSCLVDFKFHDIMELVCDIFMEIIIVDFPMIKGYKIFQIGQKRSGLTTDKKTVELKFKEQSLKFFYNLNNSYPTIVEIITNCKKAFMINENKNLTLKYNNKVINNDHELERIFNNDEFYLVFEINFVVVNDSNFINLIDTIEKIENKNNKDNIAKTPLITPSTNNEQLPSPSAGFKLTSSAGGHQNYNVNTVQKSYSLVSSSSSRVSPSRGSSVSPNSSMKTSPISASAAASGNNGTSINSTNYDRRKSSSTGSFLLDNPYHISSVQSYDRSTSNSRSNSVISIPTIPTQHKSSISSLLNNENATVGNKLIPAKFERLL